MNDWLEDDDDGNAESDPDLGRTITFGEVRRLRRSNTAAQMASKITALCFETFEKVQKSDPAFNRKHCDVIPEKRRSSLNQMVTSDKTSNLETASSSHLIRAAPEKKISESLNEIQLGEKMENVITLSKSNTNNEPPEWFTKYMDSFRKDVVKEMSSMVVENVLEVLSKQKLEPSASSQTKDSHHSRSHSHSHHSHHSHHSKPHRRHSHSRSEEKKHHKKKKKSSEDGVCYDDRFREYGKKRIRTVLPEEVRKRCKRLESKSDHFMEKPCRAQDIPKRNRKIVETFNDLGRRRNKQEDSAEEQYNMEEACILRNREDEKNLCKDEVFEKVLRVKKSPSIQDLWRKLGVDFISVSSDSNTSDSNDDLNFEVIQIPSSFNDDVSDSNNYSDEICKNARLSNDKKLNFETFKTDNNESSRESPSFELLSETPSPPVSIHIDEDHFATNENVGCSDSNITDDAKESNLGNNTVYIVDIHGKIYNNSSSSKLDDREATKFETRSKGRSYSAENVHPNLKGSYSFRDKSSNVRFDYQSSTDFNTDVNSSHASYPKSTENTNFPQSQTDLGDFSQSFHSHTMSATGNAVYGTKVSSSTNFRAADDAANSTNKPNLNINVKVNNGDKQTCERATKNGKCFCPHKSESSSSKTSPESINVQLPGTSDTIHILPETLVTGGAHVANIAYGTAREVLKNYHLQIQETLQHFKRTSWH